MSNARYCALALAALALACGDKARPSATHAAPPTASPGPAAAPAAAPAAKADAPPEWVYSSAGKRDPFKSYIAEDAAERGLLNRCNTPLGKFEIDQLRLVAVVTGLDDPVAMVEGPNGVGYTLRRGACVGRNGGQVAAIRTGEVVVSEWAIKADGTRDKTQSILKLPKEAALTIEE